FLRRQLLAAETVAQDIAPRIHKILKQSKCKGLNEFVARYMNANTADADDTTTSVSTSWKSYADEDDD
ncbi:unnamed protein product, partial [Amoebophrya sp. A25]